jgi:hypothetical protein
MAQTTMLTSGIWLSDELRRGSSTYTHLIKPTCASLDIFLQLQTVTLADFEQLFYLPTSN